MPRTVLDAPYGGHVPFGSLIFVVIIAVWAAYLIQHWIRRRDHVATARSVDRFSEAMRVLERRRVTPVAEPAAVAAPTPFDVAPARPAHPDVAVKRAERRRARADRPGRRAPRRVGPVLRALTLLLGVAALAGGAAVAALHLGPWWSAPAGAGVFVLAVAVVRLSVARARRAEVGERLARGRRSRQAPPPARRHAKRPPEARMTTAPVAAARVRGSAPLYVPAPRRVETVATAPDPATEPAATTTATGTGSPAPRRSGAEDPYDIQAADAAVAAAAEAQEAAPGSAAADAPGTWRPVPVPTPTYMLKARAHRPAAPAPADQAVSDLPFDGHAMALEEEFEELPAVNLG